MTIKVGDWVRSYSKGIWQVVREIPAHYQPRFSLKEPKKLAEGPQFLLKRLVNDKWKAAFAAEVAQASFLKPLPQADARKLQRLLAEQEEMVEQFHAFTQRVDHILNLGFSLPRRSDFVPFRRHFEQAFREPLTTGMTSDAILKTIAQSPFAACLGEIPRNATLQFVCPDHEIKRQQLVYRKVRVERF